MTDKITRLLNILYEAKELIHDIEEDLRNASKNPYLEESVFHITLSTPSLTSRFQNMCRLNEISTVRELISIPKLYMMNSRNFRGVGKKIIFEVSDFLRDNYNIIW